MKIALLVSGILGFLALAIPSLVVMGLFLGIVPGIILMLAPTVFVYLATFAVFQHILPLPPGLPLNAAAGVLTLGLGWVLALPSQIKGRIEFIKAVLPDILPTESVALSGDIRIETDLFEDLVADRDRDMEWRCSPLCAALLDTCGVTSVTMVCNGREGSARERDGKDVTFRLVAKTSAGETSIQPYKPGQIYYRMPRDLWQQEGIDGTQIENWCRALNASWSLRLSVEDTIISAPALPSADQVVRISSNRYGNNPSNKVHVARVEIADATGQILMRTSVVTRAVLAAPIHLSAYGGIENFSFGLGRKILRFGAKYFELKPIEELFRHTTLSRPKAEDVGPTIMGRLSAALDDASRSGDDPDLALAQSWFASIDWMRPLAPDMLALLNRAIADPRVPITKQLYDGYERFVDPGLRNSVATRIADERTTQVERWKLSRLLAAMPPGTFSTLTETERAILSKGAIRPQIPAFVVRLADRGSPGASDLLTIMKGDKDLSEDRVRKKMMKAVALGFARLGPQASGFLDEVDSLLKADVADKKYRFQISSDSPWSVALARMGKPVDEIDWGDIKPEAVGRKRAWLKQQVDSFDPLDWSNINHL